jgi:hypothetical protein
VRSNGHADGVTPGAHVKWRLERKLRRLATGNRYHAVLGDSSIDDEL